MPTIRIDDEVYQALGEKVIPFVDKTPNDVLRRLLELRAGDDVRSHVKQPAAYASDGPGRPRVANATPKQAYRRPILEVLVAEGGQADVRTVIKAVESRSDLLSGDLENISSGEVRWANRAKWARKDMAMEGLIGGTSQRGVWAITELGRRMLAEGRV